MARFTVRVELHDSKDYDELHKEMGKQGFSKTIESKEGKTLDLPTAEYSKIGELTIENIFASAKTAATIVTTNFSMLVTESNGSRKFYNLKEYNEEE